MKAKVIKTGEVVEVVQDFGNYLEVARNLEQSQRIWKLDELDLDYEYWAAFRKEAAKEAMNGILSGGEQWQSVLTENRHNGDCSYPAEIAQFAIACADELIKQLREDEK